MPDAPNELPSLPLQRARFLTLGKSFYSEVTPAPLSKSYRILLNEPLAKSLLIPDSLISSEKAIAELTGDRISATQTPVATVYSGHQFGVWAGQLGDGRAMLLGELRDNDGLQQEIQLKGAGETPYSRRADGRAVLRSSIREYLCSEAMHGLGIHTTRALHLSGSKQYAMREQPETTAIVTRVAPSFIRFGHFEHFYYQGRIDELKQLTDFVLQQYYPHCLSEENPYAELLGEVAIRTARLVAQWQASGFMHGVLNTDNMSVLGLTLDYGPFGFMEAFNHDHICNHSDHQGRYSYRNQPAIGQWNVFAFGQTLVPLINSVETTEQALDNYKSAFEQHWQQLCCAKFGLETVQENDANLFNEFFQLMQDHRADFTLSFRTLSHLKIEKTADDDELFALFSGAQALPDWLQRYRERCQRENRNDSERNAAMLAANPKYILRNYLAQIAIEKAQQDDFSEIDRLHRILQQPFAEQPESEIYASLPPDWAGDLCVSCSS
ncbi:protein adenylyltransferase SelO [Undibacterium luofuense]|uniref:Protein nucleotidyltransferase YdiU n=1 Tax=Undibacterium luofuense TaxID=2828733 RepID=A0A941I7W3_9BURK|nr:YdiU family protein [Undibacterium luofuense]MBR7783085.1 YdiU family protein [Undibacterium luofuense]